MWFPGARVARLPARALAVLVNMHVSLADLLGRGPARISSHARLTKQTMFHSGQQNGHQQEYPGASSASQTMTHPVAPDMRSWRRCATKYLPQVGNPAHTRHNRPIPTKVWCSPSWVERGAADHKANV